MPLTRTSQSLLETAAPVVIASTVGQFRNLQVSTTGLSANVVVTADELVVETAAFSYLTLRNVNLTLAGTASGVANGLDTGTLSISSWYSVWVMYNPTTTTTAGLLSLSATAPTLPNGYTYKARVGWIRTDASGNKYPLSFKQVGRRVQYVVAAGTNVPTSIVAQTGATGSPGTPTWTAVGINSFVPVTASRISLFHALTGASNNIGMVAPNNNYGPYGSATNAPPIVSSTGTSGSYAVAMGEFSLESTNIYVASNSGFVTVLGWEDNL